MDIEHVEPRLMRASRRLTPAVDHLRYLTACQHARRRIGLGRIDRARRDELPVIPVIDLGRRLQRCAAFPRAKAARLAPRVPELDARHGVVLADEVDAALQPRNERITPKAEIADRAAAAPLALGGLHEHEPGAARR